MKVTYESQTNIWASSNKKNEFGFEFLFLVASCNRHHIFHTPLLHSSFRWHKNQSLNIWHITKPNSVHGSIDMGTLYRMPFKIRDKHTMNQHGSRSVTYQQRSRIGERKARNKQKWRRHESREEGEWTQPQRRNQRRRLISDSTKGFSTTWWWCRFLGSKLQPILNGKRERGMLWPTTLFRH